YSDGVRGTDTKRAGPLRLTASGVAAPAAVRNAAALAFGVAAVVGLALAIAVDLRLLVVGAVAIAAAVLYTGGPRPYGYSGLGELAALPLAVQPVRLVMTRRDPPSLVAALVATARLELVVAVLLSIGLVTA